MDVLHLEDAEQALEQVEEPLRAAGAEGELSFGILHRLIGEPDAWGDDVTILLGMRSGTPAALVTMTGPHPAVIVGFTDPAEVAFAEIVGAMLTLGATADVRRDMRAFELRSVRRPDIPAGRFRSTTPQDAEIVARWTVALGADIDEAITEAEAAQTVARLTAANDLTVWERDAEVVSMAAVVRRTPWSSSIALVYTPPELRGRGFASVTVAELSQRELDAGQAWCSLFTDLANPTSNHIYTEIGYEPACDFRHFALTW
jgi:GNAT superfamily N-acetyltransferase